MILTHKVNMLKVVLLEEFLNKHGYIQAEREQELPEHPEPALFTRSSDEIKQYVFIDYKEKFFTVKVEVFKHDPFKGTHYLINHFYDSSVMNNKADYVELKEIIRTQF